MSIKGLIVAVVAGVVGAIIWGAIGFFTGYEIGIVAWGVGLLIGFAVAAVGEASPTSGIMCAVVALLSILGGKALAVKFSLDKEIVSVSKEVFEEYRYSAESVAGLSSDSELAQFMIDDEWTMAESAESVTSEEIEFFKADWFPFFDQIRSGEVTAGNWLESEYGKDWIASVHSEISIPDAVMGGLGLMDLLFGFLGIATAFKVGSGLAGND
ncbi:MAG: hypothetical protein AAGJ79_08230 [Verrucomicrobiota bacterium]